MDKKELAKLVDWSIDNRSTLLKREKKKEDKSK